MLTSPSAQNAQTPLSTSALLGYGNARRRNHMAPKAGCGRRLGAKQPVSLALLWPQRLLQAAGVEHAFHAAHAVDYFATLRENSLWPP